MSGIVPLMDIAAARGVHSPDGCTDAYARAAGDTLLPYIDRLGGVQDEGGFSGVVCGDRRGGRAPCTLPFPFPSSPPYIIISFILPYPHTPYD